MKTEIQTRRDFLGASVVAGAGIATIGANQAIAYDDEKPGRKVVGGSPYPTFSRAVVHNNVAWIAGVVGQKPGTREVVSTDFEPQCRQTLENLKVSVEAAGSSMAKVLKCTCFLTDASYFEVMNKIYVEFFPKEPPARSTVVVKELVVLGAKIEIDCMAAM